MTETTAKTNAVATKKESNVVTLNGSRHGLQKHGSR